jgi:hypothetical protein
MTDNVSLDEKTYSKLKEDLAKIVLDQLASERDIKKENALKCFMAVYRQQTPDDRQNLKTLWLNYIFPEDKGIYITEDELEKYIKEH